MNSRRASHLAAFSLLAGLIALTGNTAISAGATKAAAPHPAAAPNTPAANPNNHYQRNPAPYNPYGYGYGYGDGGSGSTTGTTTTTPNNNNQPTPQAASKSPSDSSNGSASSHDTPATQPAPTPIDPEVAAATAEVNKAMADLRGTLQSQPDYAAAEAQKQQASEDAATFHEKGETGVGDISEIAARGLAASKTISQIERAAMANDPAVQKAKAHLKDALAAQSASASSAAK